MVDFHTHILPGIDDGSPDVKTSVEMLQSLYSQGIDKVVLTPHFYLAKDSSKNFFHKREKALNELLKEVGNMDNIPKLILGAEVLLYPEISGLADLERFCIEGTNYLLVEMPFFKWSNNNYETLEKIRRGGIIPIIAHIERYFKTQKDKNMIYRLLDIGCMLQANASFFNSVLTRRKALKLLRGEMIHFIGSDCHDLKKRSPNIGNAYKIIEEKHGQYSIDNLEYVSGMVLQNANFRL
ncbi:MAG: hypothetical protein E7415_03605 [Ruminococcaceae bacterium]|nr:hypothetical protein [Oscillospiraceae bacterium]